VRAPARERPPKIKGRGRPKRWVGLGVIADNLVNISRAMANQSGR
jgi:hypothetical protein